MAKFALEGVSRLAFLLATVTSEQPKWFTRAAKGGNEEVVELARVAVWQRLGSCCRSSFEESNNSGE